VNLPRRQFLHVAAGAAALPALPRIARAQAYPARPVRIVVVVPAGGGNDIVGRLIGQFLSERIGQSFIIDAESSSFFKTALVPSAMRRNCGPAVFPLWAPTR
jgi:hypothetical protein